MPFFELLSSITAVVMLVLTTLAVIRDRRIDERQQRIEKEQARLNKVQEELAAKQLEQLSRLERERNQATVVPEIVNEGGHKYAFHITNVSGVPARDVNFELIECERSPLLRGDYDEKLPAACLAPGGRIRLIAAITMGSPRVFRGKVSWRNLDDTTAQQEYTLSL